MQQTASDWRVHILSKAITSINDSSRVAYAITALCLMFLQATEEQGVFDRLQWWRAFSKRCSSQCEQLRIAVRGKQHKATSSVSEGSWLKGLFQGKPHQDLQDTSQAEMLSEADMGRAQLQLKGLTRTRNELNLIQCSVEAAQSICTKAQGNIP